MDRVFKSATNVITLLTAAAWIITAVLGLDQQAALGLGFIPGRLSGAEVPWPALPAILTPLSANAPITALIAPLAPTIGTGEPGSTAHCASADA